MGSVQAVSATEGCSMQIHGLSIGPRNTARPERAEMITIPHLTAQALGSFLSRETEGRFRSSHSDLAKLLPFAATLTLECIGNSDALYHDIEHTMLVTLVGRRSGTSPPWPSSRCGLLLPEPAQPV